MQRSTLRPDKIWRNFHCLRYTGLNAPRLCGQMRGCVLTQPDASMTRQKPEQLIAHLLRPLTQSEMREEQQLPGRCNISQTMAGSGGWRRGRLLISPWTSVASISGGLSVMRKGEVRSEAGAVLCVYMWWNSHTAPARQTGSLTVHYVSQPVWRQQLVASSPSHFALFHALQREKVAMFTCSRRVRTCWEMAGMKNLRDKRHVGGYIII